MEFEQNPKLEIRNKFKNQNPKVQNHVNDAVTQSFEFGYLIMADFQFGVDGFFKTIREQDVAVNVITFLSFYPNGVGHQSPGSRTK